MSEDSYDAVIELCKLLRDAKIEPWFHLPECSIWMIPNRCDHGCSLRTWREYVLSRKAARKKR